MSLKVVESYAVNLVVGSRLDGDRAKGFPGGGPADRFLAGLARLLAGCEEGASVFELAGPCELRAEEPVVVGVATYGDRFWHGGLESSGCSRVLLEAAESLKLGAPERSVRVYLAGRFEAVDGVLPRALEAGELFSGSGGRGDGTVKLARVPSLEVGVLRWVRAVGFDQTVGEATVLPQGSRVGVRLDAGCEGAPALGLSEPSLTGVIQVTPDGTLLVHGVDGPTIGGYPKAGAVVSSDWDRIGQLRAGDRVVLEEVSLEEAGALAEEYRRRGVEWGDEVRGVLGSVG